MRVLCHMKAGMVPTGEIGILVRVVKRSVLVRVSGRDRPGITAGLMDVLAAGGAEIGDVEQVLVRGRLSLDILVDLPEEQSVLKELLFYGWEQDIHLDFEVVESAPAVRAPGSVVTIIAPEVTPAAFGSVARSVADGGGNIDRIVRISRYPVVSYELAVSGGDLDRMRRSLGNAASLHAVDIAIQEEGLTRRAKRLVVLDVDSTLIQDEAIELVAEEIGIGAQVADLTQRAMEGAMDFEEALRQRVALFAGAPVEVLADAAEQMRLTPGARTFVRTLKRLGMKVAAVSGGFDVFVERLREELDMDHVVANRLEIRDGVLTGNLLGEVVDGPGKVTALRKIATSEGIPLAQTVAVGDGANDADMLSVAGLGIAFNAKPVAQQAADTTLSVPYLDAILFLLGIRREEIEAADSHDGIAARTAAEAPE